MAEEKSKILIIGGTGYIGKFILEASAQSEHPTFALIRESAALDPAKASLIESFKRSGVTILYGDLNDHESLVNAIKQVDVVISTVGSLQIPDQTKIIDAIKEAGNVKRFFPSEFGLDVDRAVTVEPAKSAFGGKVQIRRTIEASGIPYTFVSSNYFAGYSLPTLAQADAMGPPIDKIVILGDGDTKGFGSRYPDIQTRFYIGYCFNIQTQPKKNIEHEIGIHTYILYPGWVTGLDGPLPPLVYEAQASTLLAQSNPCCIVQLSAIFVDEKDIGTYTIKAVDDPRTLNKTLYIRPPANIYTHNELISLWEKKTSKTLERIYLSEEEVLTKIEETAFPFNIVMAINYSVFVKGDTANFEIKESFGVEASKLYPDVKYTTVDEYISRLV